MGCLALHIGLIQRTLSPSARVYFDTVALWRAQDGEACRNDLPDGESGNIFALGLDGQSESFVQIEPRHHQMIATN
jgi:hypothetical protein